MRDLLIMVMVSYLTSGVAEFRVLEVTICDFCLLQLSLPGTITDAYARQYPWTFFVLYSDLGGSFGVRPGCSMLDAPSDTRTYHTTASLSLDLLMEARPG